MPRRIVITPPAHPGVMAILLLILIAPLLWGAWLPDALLSTLAPLRAPWAAPVVLVLLALSPVLGFFNLIVLRRRTYATVMEMDYVTMLGIPVPVARPRLEEAESLVAVNIGGALVPAGVAAGMALAEAFLPAPVSPELLAATAVATAVVASVTYKLSRIMPGVGIIVPGLLPPVMSIGSAAIIALALGLLMYAPAIAYVAAVFGTLIGADLLNLARNGDKLNAWLISIGGAGTFDGIFMSGVLAILLASIII